MTDMITADFANFDPRNFYSESQVELSTDELSLPPDRGVTTFRAEFEKLVERLQAPDKPPSATLSGFGGRGSSLHAAGSSSFHRGVRSSDMDMSRQTSPSVGHDEFVENDLGVPHQSGITSFDYSESPRLSAAKASGRTDGPRLSIARVAAIPTASELIDNSMCEEQMTKALNVLSSYLAKMHPGALVLEIGSRCGDVSIALSRRFPGLWMQPTEGTGRTSHSLQLLLEERIKQYGRELEQEGVRAEAGDAAGGKMLGAAGRLLKPKFFDGGKLRDWLMGTHSHGNPSLVFAINVLHFLSWNCVETIIDGAGRTLRSGALLFLCGPFAEKGRLDTDNLLFHAALGEYAQALRARGEHHVSWGLHDVQRISECAKVHGLEVERKTQFGYDERPWFAIVLRKPGGPKPQVVTSFSSMQHRRYLAAEKHMKRLRRTVVK